MVSRRQYLALLSIPTVAVAGCPIIEPDPEPEPDTPVPPVEETPTPTPDDEINVKEYGAVGDGSTDDTAAIQAAIDAAETGTTIYFPEPADAYMVSRHSGSDIITIDGEIHNNDLTIQGENQNTEIRLFEDMQNSYSLFWISSPENFNLTIRNLVLDGNRGSNDGVSQYGHGITFRDNHANRAGNMVVENVEVKNCRTSGISVQYGGVTCENSTSHHNGSHGVEVATNRSGIHEPYPYFKYFHSHSNAVGTYGVGMNFSGGTGIAEDVVIERNHGNAGTKVSIGAIDITYRRVRIEDNQGMIFQITGNNDGARVTFEDVVCRKNNGPLRLSDNAEYIVPKNSRFVVSNNLVDSRGQIYLTDSAVLKVDGAIYSNGIYETVGLNSVTSETGSYIANFYHGEADQNPVGRTQNIEIHHQDASQKKDLDNVPRSEDVGVWSESDI